MGTAAAEEEEEDEEEAEVQSTLLMIKTGPGLSFFSSSPQCKNLLQAGYGTVASGGRIRTFPTHIDEDIGFTFKSDC
ncbi:hypothetical protein F2P81_008992 [Scophthalmus maximus]|uniref:Uncharacterized protein n=1 Tax=Scophthalmus maximus TaxID=52904 RepID=A0A6A4T2E1_SCOMX|nr:hypothetical protein F2P81_008992 [Scophthalmus maximus]